MCQSSIHLLGVFAQAAEFLILLVFFVVLNFILQSNTQEHFLQSSEGDTIAVNTKNFLLFVELREESCKLRSGFFGQTNRIKLDWKNKKIVDIPIR